jgi:hypothetical protein
MAKAPFILRPLAVLLFSAVVFACGSDDDSKSDCDDGSDPACGICNPAENLPWLHAEIATLAGNEEYAIYAYVLQGTYHGQTVFVTGSCCPSCLSITIVKGCDGTTIESVTIDDVSNRKAIWKGGDCAV